jgi:hypothetical protein
MKQMPVSRASRPLSLNRRDLLQLASMFGLTLTVPSFGAKAPTLPLAPDEMALIAEVSELIIPTTDTGGAMAAGVPAFVKMMLANWFGEAEREHFIAGLREFSIGAHEKYGKDFGKLAGRQKNEYFGALLAAAEAHTKTSLAPFVVLMKRLTIFGYYTSELGATSELHQQIASAQYVPAAVFKPGDRADSGITSATYPFNAS